jgi:hypothetical protein
MRRRLGRVEEKRRSRTYQSPEYHASCCEGVGAELRRKIE